jgi:hypothetical protein
MEYIAFIQCNMKQGFFLGIKCLKYQKAPK